MEVIVMIHFLNFPNKDYGTNLNISQNYESSYLIDNLSAEGF